MASSTLSQSTFQNNSLDPTQNSATVFFIFILPITLILSGSYSIVIGGDRLLSASPPRTRCRLLMVLFLNLLLMILIFNHGNDATIWFLIGTSLLLTELLPVVLCTFRLLVRSGSILKNVSVNHHYLSFILFNLTLQRLLTNLDSIHQNISLAWNLYAMKLIT